MKRGLRWCALGVGLAGLTIWLAGGANHGCTKTSKPRNVVDEITGIPDESYEKAFIPGIEFLGGAILGAGALAGVSVLIRSKDKTESK